MAGPDVVPARAGNLFPETRWTLVLAAKSQPERRRQAFEELVRPRYKALYVIARKRGLAPSEAEDAVQGFLTQLLEGDLLTRLDPEKGRLRSYLKAALAHYLSNLWQQGRAEKRGGGQANLDLAGVEELISADAPTPEALFDRAWALCERRARWGGSRTRIFSRFTTSAPPRTAPAT